MPLRSYGHAFTLSPLAPVSPKLVFYANIRITKLNGAKFENAYIKIKLLKLYITTLSTGKKKQNLTPAPRDKK